MAAMINPFYKDEGGGMKVGISPPRQSLDLLIGNAS
jgi:hypothetical protein